MEKTTLPEGVSVSLEEVSSKFLDILTICLIIKYHYKILVVCGLCGVQSSSDMSGISTLLLPAPLLNNILNFKVIFQPPLITSPSPQRRVDRDQCTMSVVFMIKMKSIMFAFSQLSLH